MTEHLSYKKAGVNVDAAEAESEPKPIMEDIDLLVFRR